MNRLTPAPVQLAAAGDALPGAGRSGQALSRPRHEDCPADVPSNTDSVQGCYAHSKKDLELSSVCNRSNSNEKQTSQSSAVRGSGNSHSGCTCLHHGSEHKPNWGIWSSLFSYSVARGTSRPDQDPYAPARARVSGPSAGGDVCPLCVWPAGAAASWADEVGAALLSGQPSLP